MSASVLPSIYNPSGNVSVSITVYSNTLASPFAITRLELKLSPVNEDMTYSISLFKFVAVPEILGSITLSGFTVFVLFITTSEYAFAVSESLSFINC